jgi:Protein of unknown function (DUF2917)
MLETVPFHEQRSVNDCGGGRVVAEADEPRFVASNAVLRSLAIERLSQRWMRRIARVVTGMTKRQRNANHGTHELSKGFVRRIYLADGGRISCRAGKLWMTLDDDRQDIVLTARQSKSFRPGDCVVVEALTDSRFSLETL